MFNKNYKNCSYMNNDVETCNENNNDLNIFDDSCTNCQNECEITDNCQCGFDETYSTFPDNPVLGQAYTPIQQINNVFKPCVGLKMGTIFPELVSPYMPCQSIEEINYLRMTNEIKGGCNTCQ